jgi:hypothetical protein
VSHQRGCAAVHSLRVGPALRAAIILCPYLGYAFRRTASPLCRPPIAAAKPHVQTSRAAVIPPVDASGNDVPRATYAKTDLQADAAAPSDSYLQNSRPDRPASH